MELTDALRTTGAVRDFTDQAVDDAVLARVLDTARFAPSGSNAQAWRLVITTIAIRAETEVKAVLGAPDPLALAAIIALGYPVRQPRRLRREPVSSFATVDSIGGPVFGAP
jgi:nitroreductase